MNETINADKTIEKKCCYCEYANEIKNMETYLCNKQGVVAYDFTCKKFKFDPLKLSPMLPAKRLKFSAEDFALNQPE